MKRSQIAILVVISIIVIYVIYSSMSGSDPTTAIINQAIAAATKPITPTPIPVIVTKSPPPSYITISDDSKYTPSTIICNVYDNGSPYKDPRLYFMGSWGDSSANWIWHQNMTNIGYYEFKKTWAANTISTAKITIQTMCSKFGAIYLNGNKVLDCGGTQDGSQTTKTDLTINPIIINYITARCYTASSPGGLLLSVYNTFTQALMDYTSQWWLTRPLQTSELPPWLPGFVYTTSNVFVAPMGQHQAKVIWSNPNTTTQKGESVIFRRYINFKTSISVAYDFVMSDINTHAELHVNGLITSSPFTAPMGAYMVEIYAKNNTGLQPGLALYMYDARDPQNMIVVSDTSWQCMPIFGWSTSHN